MSGVIIVTSLLLLLVLVFVHEARGHERNLSLVPVRVHVNGTRGKSSVTRLIAAGLRAGGFRTIAKTTGTKPRFIYPDGSEVPVVRAGKANIIEQVRIFRRAAQLKAEILVLECMAIKPELQTLLEDRIVRSTHSVITNARADHLDEMGPTVKDVAKSLSRTISRNGILFSADPDHVDIFKQVARERHTRVREAGANEVSSEELSGFSYIEHPDNVALALAVCSAFGVDRRTSLNAMYDSTPDPGALRIDKLKDNGRSVWFVNGFAINDPDSYVLVWERLKTTLPNAARIVGLIVCRPDRLQRSQQLAELACHRLPLDVILVAGAGTAPLLHHVAHEHKSDRTYENLAGHSVEQIFERIRGLAKGSPLVIYGIGNMVGLGEEVAEFFREKASAENV